MAPRRLLAVLVVLLVASVVAAAIAPDREGPLIGRNDNADTAATTETTTGPSAEPEEAGSASAARRIDASAKRPMTVAATVGEQLALTVDSDRGLEIAIVPLGLVDFAGPDDPASFNILLREPGRYAITEAEDPATVVGNLVVSDPGEPPGKAGAEGRQDRAQGNPD